MKILCSNETEFKVFGPKAKHYVWHKPNTAQHPGNTISSIKCGEWQHYVWAFFFQQEEMESQLAWTESLIQGKT